MSRRLDSVLPIAVVIGLALVTHQHLDAQARNRITQPIDESKLVTLRGNTHPSAQPANDRGPVEDSTRMDDVWLLLKRPPELEKAFTSFLEEQQNPKSPNFHKWLTPQQIGDQYGPSPEDIATVARWLEASGFKVNHVAPHGRLIDFSGTVGQVRQAFHTEIHHFEVNGERHYANVSDPQIPAALEPVVAGPVSLHNFMPRPMHSKKMAPVPNYTVSTSKYAVVPGDLATIYNFNPAYAAGFTGTGVTIVAVQDSDIYTPADFGVFRKEFGLARPYRHGSVTQVNPAAGAGGTCLDPGATNNDSEAILDAEWSSAAAPNATIVVASCSDTGNFGGFIAMENILTNGSPIPAIVSISYGVGESQRNTAFNQYVNSLYQFATGLGVSIFVASGDYGPATNDGVLSDRVAFDGITTNGFATTPYDVAVGGTDFGDAANHIPYSTYWNSTNGTYFNSALSYIQEIPWNASCGSLLIAQFESYTQTYGSTGFCNSGLFLDLTAAGGGPSSIYPKPIFQSGFPGNPADGWRDVPDVSLFASSGVWNHYYVFCNSDTSHGGTLCTGPPNTWNGVGGTSVSTPIMSGIMGLVVQKNGAAQGNPLSRIYAMAGFNYGGTSLAQCNSSNGNAAGTSCIFYDVTQGDIDVPCAGSLNCYLPSGTYGVLSTSNSAYQPAYGTGTGWDFATGIGTVNVFNFVTLY